MIAKGKSISHLTASIQYALRREEAVVLDKNIVSESPSEVAKEFKLFQELNQRCTRNSLSFVLSPTIEDGQKLNHEQLEKLNQSFLEKMDLKEHQYIAFVHQNTKHKHIHLYVNRIDFTGKAYDDQFISNRSAHVAETIAKDMGLLTARSIQQGKYQERQEHYPRMESIKQLAKATLDQQGINSIDQFISSFNQQGSKMGLRAEAYNNKQGVFQGLRFYDGEQKFKASQIDRSLSKQNLEYIFQNQVEKLPETTFSPKMEVPSMPMAPAAIGILGSLMGPRLNVNKAIEEDEEELDKDKKKKLEKKRGLGMGR